MMNLIQTVFLYYTVISMVESGIGFNQRCPWPNEWHFRRKNCTASDKPFYACLYNEYGLQYSENCTREEYESRKGKKVVFSPGISETDCADNRFQPFKFTTHSFSDCIYAKSTCSETGQVLVTKGSSFVDRSCRCDYRTGYNYIIQPKDKCSCVPLLEDCSCYLTNCIGDSALTQDYECVLKIDSRPGSNVCGKIPKGSPVNVTTANNNTLVDKKEHSSTSSLTAFTCILIFMCIPVVSTLMLWVSVNKKVMPHIKVTNGISKKDRIIYIEDGIPKTYHVIEGDDFTIICEIKSPLLVKSVRWQRDGHDINLQSSEDKLNDHNSYFTIENLSASHTGNYTCLVSNYLGFNNTTVDRCINYLSALHRMMTWIQALHQFYACNKEDQHTITITVHSLPTATEYKVEEKLIGDQVTLTPVSTDIVYVVWFYKTEAILSALKPDQYSYKNDWSVKAEQNENTENGDEEAIQHGDSKDGAAKSMHQPDTKDGAVTKQKVDINAGGTPNIHALVFKAAVSDGQYVCFAVTATKKIIGYGWKLKVILQVSTHEELLMHRKDISYVKTPTIDKAVECLKNNGYVVIVGRKGTGKSKLCLQLEALFEEKDYLPFKVNENMSLRKMTDMIDDLKSTKIVFLLDDSDYSPDSLDKRLSVLPEVSGNSNAKVIFTCTQTCLPMIKNILQKWKLYRDKATIDLNNEANILPLEVKKEILERLSKSTSVKLDADLVNAIIKTNPFYGFPFVAKKFCSSDGKYLKKRERYFTNPPKSLRKEIQDLYISSFEKKKPDLMDRYCVLVYISTDKSHCLDSSNTNFARIQQIKKLFYDYTAKESPLDDIAESLVGKYLAKADDHTYTIIHPAVLKAVFLSSEYFAKYIVEEGEIDDIIENIRGELYEVLDGELILKLETESYTTLCERLLNLFLERPHFGEKIGDYIYHHFISLEDQNFLKTFFLNLKKYFPLKPVIEKENETSEKGSTIRERETKDNEESACVNMTDSDKTKKSQSSPLPMIRLFEHLTRSGKDSWVYTVDEVSIPDFGILYGLIMACKNNFYNDEDKKKKNTFQIILDLFGRRCQEKYFQLNLLAPMDIYGNVFCHFLALFCENESCLILEELFQHLQESKFGPKKMFSEKTKKPFKVNNILFESPMKLSVYLGKAKLFKLIWQKTNSKEKKRIEDLSKITEIGMKLGYGSGSSTTEVKSFLNLDKDFSQLVLRGEKDGYTDIIKTLNK